METKPLKLEKDGTLKNVSDMSDKELLDKMKAKLNEDVRNCNAKKLAEFKSICKEAKFSLFLFLIVNFVLFYYSLCLLLNGTPTISKTIGVISVFIIATAILRAFLLAFIEFRHEEGCQVLKDKESTSTDTLSALCHYSKITLTAYTVRYIYSEFIDTEEFGDIDDETKCEKILDFAQNYCIHKNLFSK